MTPRTQNMLDHATVANLRALKLLGFADGLTEQMAQPDVLALSFEERLALLVDREMNARSDRKRTRLLQRAQLKYGNASIEDAQFDAIRKDTSQPSQPSLKRGDLFDIVLIQVKGGSARDPTRDDCLRLRKIAKHYRARAVALFHWQKGVTASCSVMIRRTLVWQQAAGAAIFG